MSGRCRVEAVDLQCSEKHFVTLPELILRRSDLMLVASGSLSCVRALYFRALELEKGHQFMVCPVTRSEYGSGRYEEKLRQSLEQAVTRPGVGGVVIYASCPDILVRCDFERLIRTLKNPDAIPVKVLYRGPLVKRTRDVDADLEDILNSFPSPAGALAPAPAPLPPLPPDLSGAASLLQPWDSYNFLITPGGCTGCISLPDGLEEDYRLEHTRFNDLQVAMGCGDLTAEGIAARYPESGRGFCAVLGSAVPTIVGLDQRHLQQRLSRDGIPSVLLPCDGFSPAQVGISRALTALGRAFLDAPLRRERRINILGWSALGLGDLEQLSEVSDYFENEGYVCEVWGVGSLSHVRWGGEAALNWVVSVEGLALAEQMRTDFGVPYVTGLPVGSAALHTWLAEAAALLEFAPVPSPRSCPPPRPDGRRVLVLAQPMLAVGVRGFLTGEMGFSHVSAGCYAPARELQELFSAYTAQNGIAYLTGTGHLDRWLRGAELVIADPICRARVAALEPQAAFVPLPDPMLSGRFSKEHPYRFLGVQGGAYLRDHIADIDFSHIQQ